MTNTLLNRCLQAYEDAFEDAIVSAAINPESRRAGVRAVIEHLAAELVVMKQRNQGRLSAHDAAGLLLDELRGQVIPLRRDPEGAA